MREISDQQRAKSRFLSIRSPWWGIGGSWLGWRGTGASTDAISIIYLEYGDGIWGTSPIIFRVKSLDRDSKT